MSLGARLHDTGPRPGVEHALTSHFAERVLAVAELWWGELGGVLLDAGHVSKLLRHPVRHIRLSWLLSHSMMRSFAAHRTKLRLKYLVEYAAKNLTTEQRYYVLSAHYIFLQRKFQPVFLESVANGPVCIWQQASSKHAALTIEMDFPSSMHTEGDLRLTLKSGRRSVFRLIFSIAHGVTFGIHQDDVILITCLQGLQGTLDVRDVSAACNGVHPTDLLMAALGGVATAIGIDILIGITTANQIANKGRIFFSYDDFFAIYGRYRDGIDAYVIAVPFAQRPISEIASKYRGRTNAKRNLRHAVSASAQGAMAPFLEAGSYRA